MKKMPLVFLGAVIALSFSLMSFGCAEHKTMQPMEMKAVTTHNATMKKEVPETMNLEKPTHDMKTGGMEKKMATPLEEKKM
jgi:hypothetical protein